MGVRREIQAMLKKVIFPYIYNKLKRKDGIEPISGHIPKTAGTAFLNTLLDVYDTKKVVQDY